MLSTTRLSGEQSALAFHRGIRWTERVAPDSGRPPGAGPQACRVSGVLSTQANLCVFVESFVLLGRKGVSGVPAVLPP